MHKNQDLTWSQVAMAANAPMLTEGDDGRRRRRGRASCPTGQVVGVIDELPDGGRADRSDHGRGRRRAHAARARDERGDATVHGECDAGFGAVADAFAANFTDHGDVGAACAIYRDGRARRRPLGRTRRPRGRPHVGTRHARHHLLDHEGRHRRRAATGSSSRAASIPTRRWRSTGPSSRRNGKGDDPGEVGAVTPRRAGALRRDVHARRRDGDRARRARPRRAGAELGARIDARLPRPHVRLAYRRDRAPGHRHEPRRPTSPRRSRRRSASTTSSACPRHSSPVSLVCTRRHPPTTGCRRSSTPRSATRTRWMGKVMSGPSGLFAYNDMWNTRALHATEMPSSNGIGDARSLARLYASCIGDVAIADGGAFRTIDDATVGRATTLLSDGTDTVLGMPTAFGLGFTGPQMLPPGVGFGCLRARGGGRFARLRGRRGGNRVRLRDEPDAVGNDRRPAHPDPRGRALLRFGLAHANACGRRVGPPFEHGDCDHSRHARAQCHKCQNHLTPPVRLWYRLDSSQTERTRRTPPQLNHAGVTVIPPAGGHHVKSVHSRRAARSRRSRRPGSHRRAHRGGAAGRRGRGLDPSRPRPGRHRDGAQHRRAGACRACRRDPGGALHGRAPSRPARARVTTPGCSWPRASGASSANAGPGGAGRAPSRASVRSLRTS